MAHPSHTDADRRRGLRSFGLASLSLGLGLLVLAAPSARATQPNPDHKVTLCHATHSEENPYVEITVDIGSVKFLGHHLHKNDVIPSFTIGSFSYPGKNVPAGQAILDNECEVPPPTTSSSSSTSSSTSTTAEVTTTSSSTSSSTTSTTEEPTTTSTTEEPTTTSSSTSSSTSTTVESSSTTVEDSTTSTEAPTTTAASTTNPTAVEAEFLTAPDDLPKTGGDSTPLAATGVAFVTLGVAVLALQRRLSIG